ncbi:VOC family protein [Roseomonas sp. BN140053]|uniref:VOC family protein n=1 Tax=Roseomonas sp. BN140053 TaxID=3391898 RepID=UPI0039E913E4
MAYPTPLLQNDTLSHGTVECSDMVTTRRFLTEFLGLDIHRPVKEAQYMYKGGPWTVVCVRVDGGEAKDQTQDNLFKLSVNSAAEVDAAHEAALRHAEEYGIRKVEPPRDADGLRSFRLQDLNFTWWEISNVALSHYDALFDRGDVAH